MRPRSRTVEEEIGRRATATHGVVTRAELLAAGVSGDQITRRIKRGDLRRIHPGVYRVGHGAPSIEATYLAAVKACGPGALLCGQAAGHLWELTRGALPHPEVLAPRARSVRGVIVHRARRVDGRDRPAGNSTSHLEDSTRRRGIPVTNVARTLVDLAAYLPEPALARACHQAQVRYRTAPDQVEHVLARRPSSPGRRTLERILRGDVRVTLSALESRFLARLRAANLPLPETNRKTGTHRVDCRWPEHALSVELDGYRYHHSRHAWEQDRRREREARARGDEFRRYTHRDVFEDPGYMLSELETLLGAAAVPDRGR